LLVVARLAARHGIRVRLNQADLGGLTALVWLPDEILTHYSAAADPGHPAAAPRGAAARSPAFVPARTDQPAAQPGPAWSARGQAESRTTMRRLPIFDEVESRWSRSTPEASGPVGVAAAAGPSPAGPPARGLPRRPPGFQRRAGQGRTAPPEEGNPGGPDES
jgi:hypothetical protein